MSTDVVVVGSGPNGLAACVTLARAGLSVEVFEARDTIGGGLRTEALFDSAVLHDICAAAHPLASASPFFRQFDLGGRGVRLLQSAAAYAHPLRGGATALAYRDLDRTCHGLGPDGRRWRAIMRPLVEHSSDLVELFLTGPAALPAAARASIGLALSAAREGTRWTRTPWRTEGAAALLAGVQAHVTGPLPSLPGAVIGLFLGHLAHHGGWPVVAGGSQAIAAALAADARAHGASIHTGYRVTDLADLPPARAVLLDVSPREFLRLAGPQMPSRYRAQLERFQYGPGAAKVDFLLSDPVPWLDPSTQEATTVHLGGTRREIYLQETLTARGVATERPFVLVVDPAAADPERATRNRRPLWAYAHVPHGSAVDPFDLVRARIEEHAPGFSETIQAHRSLSAAQYEGYNPNYVGGDIAGGALTLRQTVARPRLQRDPYRTPLPGVYLCSASTPPGPGVHGMCGYRAARAALRREFGVVAPIDLAPGEDSVPA